MTRRRKFYEEKSLALGTICFHLGLKPNILTGISLLFSLVASIFLWKRSLFLALLFILLNSFADMLDGSTARASGKTSLFGGVLDHLVDRFGEFFILMGILLSGFVPAYWVLFSLFGMLSASYVRAAAESIGKMESCTVGLAGRTEKIICLILGIIGEMVFPQRQLLSYGLILAGAISYITTLQRLLFARKQMRKED
ncbi:MAG: CDP-alcohol phosphatidyltransferase family protein [Candidatus Edwardsbacteria bacterium]